MGTFTIPGQLIDLHQRRIYPATIEVADGVIAQITEVDDAPGEYILPGFIDAHVHIESSMLVPTEFARLAVVHGTVATISDPHEIGNVCGIAGIEYMIADAKRTPFKIFFGAPSCVPATSFETAGATIDAAGIEQLINSKDIWYLSEVMNYPGVLHRDPEVMAKIAATIKAGKPIDGHAPGLRGADVVQYASAGITTDHECFTLDEALDKVKAGMKILIREGSAAKNYEALHPLLSTHPSSVMFCSDDKHPDDLVLHHINDLVKRSLAKGYDVFDVLRAACVHPAEHYNVPVGLLKEHDAADFIVIDSLNNFNVLKTYINGELVAENGKSLLPYIQAEPINSFDTNKKTAQDFHIPTETDRPEIRVIEAIEGQLVTNELRVKGKTENGLLVSDVTNDILKMAVVNRYQPGVRVATAFIKNFGLKRGALASTVAHDCHNIVVVGTTDEDMRDAVNALIDAKGGICVSTGGNAECMALPVAGLMSTEHGKKVAELYSALDGKAKELGTTLKAPFMTLSFMALLVIPALKLSDKGLFDGSKFAFTSVEVE